MYICAVGYECELRSNSGLCNGEEKRYLALKSSQENKFTGKQCKPIKEVSELFNDYFHSESGIKEKLYEGPTLL